MKVHWLLLFGTLSNTINYTCACLMSDKEKLWFFLPGEDTCYIDFGFCDDDRKSFVLHGVGSRPLPDGKERGCVINGTGTGFCTCSGYGCNSMDRFLQDLYDAANGNTEIVERIFNCDGPSNEECAVRDSNEIRFEKRKKSHVCHVWKNQEEYIFGQIEIAKQENSWCALDDDDVSHCYCLGHRCNINNDTFIEGNMMAEDQEEEYTSYVNALKTCGYESSEKAMLDHVGDKVCAKVFWKDYEGQCLSDVDLVSEEETGCFTYDDQKFSCVCKENSCAAQNDLVNLLAASNLRLDENQCVHVVPTTTTSTTTTSTTTTTPTTTTTTKPEQLTCWISAKKTLTKEKSTHVCFIEYHMNGQTCEVSKRAILEVPKPKTGCRIVHVSKKAVLRCTCAEYKCNSMLHGMWKYVQTNNVEHRNLIECANREIHGGDYMECAPGVFTRKTDGCQIKFEQKKMEEIGRENETECAVPEVTALFNEQHPWDTCQTNDSVTHCYCNTPYCLAGKEYGRFGEFLKNVSWELYLDDDSLSCAFNHYNLPIPQPSTLAITSTTQLPPKAHQAKTSFFSGWHIGTIVFVGLLVVTILFLIAIIIKLKKGGEGKKEKAKEKPQDMPQPTAIKIEKPAEKKDIPIVNSKKGDKQETVVDTTGTTGQENNDTETGDSTVSGGDTTGTEGTQVRVSVRALKKH